MLDYIRLVGCIHSSLIVLVALRAPSRQTTSRLSIPSFPHHSQNASRCCCCRARRRCHHQRPTIQYPTMLCEACPLNAPTPYLVSKLTRALFSFLSQLNCLTSALAVDGCSELTDFACHCQKTGLVEQVVPCVKQTCDVTDQQGMRSHILFSMIRSNHAL